MDSYIASLDALSVWEGWEAVASLASAAALGWAIFLAGQQAADARRRERAFVEALVATILFAYRCAEDVSAAYHGAFPKPSVPPDDKGDIVWFRRMVSGDPHRLLEATARRLEQVDITKIPSRALVYDFLMVMAHVGHMRAGLDAFLSDGAPPERPLDDVGGLLFACEGFFETARRFGAKTAIPK